MEYVLDDAPPPHLTSSPPDPFPFPALALYLFTEYEVLVGHPSAVKWVRHLHGQPCAPEGFRPVEGGRDGQGNFLFVARAPCGGGRPFFFLPFLPSASDSWALTLTT